MNGMEHNLAVVERHIRGEASDVDRLVGPGVVNAPLPIGSRVELRLVHHFSMRDGRIAREQVFEIWRPVDAGTRSPEQAQAQEALA